MSSGNPLFNEKAFEQTMHRTDARNAMTLQGTINRTFFLLLLCVTGALITWNNYQAFSGWFWPLFIVAVASMFIVTFKKTLAPVLSPVYAISEGMILGLISVMYNAQTQGIAIQAVMITMLVFLVMLFLYSSKIIRVTRGLVIGIVAATGAIALFYLISIVLSLFGISGYFGSTSTLSIVINLVICGVAAFNFLLDFEFINQMTTQQAAPKYMEWYAGFSLTVTLVWLYLEILRLLSRMQQR